MPQSLHSYDQSQGGDRSAPVLDTSDQNNLMAGRKNNEPLSVQTGQGTSSIAGSQTSSPMRHDKKHIQSAPITVGMPASSNAVTMVGHAPMAVTMGVQGQIGAIPPEFIPRVGMHYDGQQQQGYMQQQHVAHPPYQSYVPYPGNNQAYIHSGYHPQMVRPAPQQHYQPHQGPGHEMTVMHQQQQQQQQQQQHNLARGRIDERVVENYAGTYNGNNRMMTGYPYRNMSASISDYPYDATYGSNQQGGQLTGFYAPMPVQVGMVDGGGVPIPGGIITVAGPLNMGPEHERLLVLAKGNEQHKQVSDMLLKAAQTEALTSRKRCEELTAQIEDLKKQLEDVKLENEAYKASAAEAKIAADSKVAELDAAELLKETKEAALALVQKNLAATSIANGTGFDSKTGGDSSSAANTKDSTADVVHGRHGTDQAATSLVKSVLLSPQHHSAATSPSAAGVKAAAKTQKSMVGDDDDDDDDESSPDRPMQGRNFRGVQGQNRSRSNSNLDNNSKGPGKVQPDQFQRGPRPPGSYNAFDKGRERDSYDSSAVPSYSGFGQGQGQGRGAGRGGQGMPMRAHNPNQSDARGGPGGGGNGVRPLRPTRIILPPGTTGPQGVNSPGGSGIGPHLDDSATVDQGQVNTTDPPSGTKGDGAARGDVKKGPITPSYDSSKKGSITSPPPLGNRVQGNGRPFGTSTYIPRDYSAQKDLQDSDQGSPARMKSPPAPFFSNSPDEQGRNAGGGSWTRKEPVRPVRERKPGDEGFDNNTGRVIPERRVELTKTKKPVKITKTDKLHPEREGRADGAGTKGDSNRGPDEDDDDNKEKRIVVSQSPQDIRDSSRDVSNTPPSAFTGGAEYQGEDTSRIASSSSAATSAPMHQGAPAGSETRSNASSVVCRFYAKGACIFGAKCQNIHSGSGGNRPPIARPPTAGIEDVAEIEDDQDGGPGRVDRVEKRAGRGKERPGRDGGRETTGRGRGGRGVKRTPFPAPSTSPSNGGAQTSPPSWTEGAAPASASATAPASDVSVSASASASVAAVPSASDTPHNP